MRRAAHSSKSILALAAAGIVVAGAGGCGDQQEPNLVAGKEMFVQKCGSCHVLERAGTTGTQGPSLDAAFGPSRRDGLGQGTIRGVVRNQIGNVRRGSIMPEDLVTGQAARNVAAYVAAVAGLPGEDQGLLAEAGQPETSSKPIPAESGTLRMPADPTGALAFASTRAIARAGEIEFVMPNPSSVQHNIAVKNGGAKGEGPVVGEGGTSSFTTTLRAGKFTYFCSVPGHEEGGMTGEITVR